MYGPNDLDESEYSLKNIKSSRYIYSLIEKSRIHQGISMCIGRTCYVEAEESLQAELLKINSMIKNRGGSKKEIMDQLKLIKILPNMLQHTILKIQSYDNAEREEVFKLIAEDINNFCNNIGKSLQPLQRDLIEKFLHCNRFSMSNIFFSYLNPISKLDILPDNCIMDIPIFNKIGQFCFYEYIVKLELASDDVKILGNLPLEDLNIDPS